MLCDMLAPQYPKNVPIISITPVEAAIRKARDFFTPARIKGDMVTMPSGIF